MAFQTTDPLVIELIRAGMPAGDARALVNEVPWQQLWHQVAYQRFRLETGYPFKSGLHASNYFRRACIENWGPPMGYVPGSAIPKRDAMAPLSGHDLLELEAQFNLLIEEIGVLEQAGEIQISTKLELQKYVEEIRSFSVWLLRAALANNSQGINQHTESLSLADILIESGMLPEVPQVGTVRSSEGKATDR